MLTFLCQRVVNSTSRRGQKAPVILMTFRIVAIRLSSSEDQDSHERGENRTGFRVICNSQSQTTYFCHNLWFIS